MARESKVRSDKGATFVNTNFAASVETQEQLLQLEKDYPNAIIVGSIIAAQAFPGRVFAMTPCPGYERVAPSEKRMDPHKFTTFGIKGSEFDYIILLINFHSNNATFI